MYSRVAVTSFLVLSCFLLSPCTVTGKEPVDWVDPTISTASPHGPRWIFFASACRPFGMVNLSPDTIPRAKGGLRGMGYVYTSNVIHGFSHVHAWQLSGVPVMPTSGPLKGPNGSKVYGSKFSHDSEVICPGYHAVTLDDYGIRAELTSTDRVGLHRYTFPKSDKSRVLFDLGAPLGPSKMDKALARKVSDTELEGYVVNSRTWRRPKPTPIYFVARFDKPFETFGGWVGKKVLDDVDEVSGKGSGAFVEYATAEKEVVQLKVAISYVSIEQARLNLDTELPHWDFDRVKRESRQTWNEWLGKIEVEGGTDAQRTRFYTDLWHVLLGRRTSSDVDGKYCDMTGPKPVVRQIPAGPDGKPKYAHYNTDAFWCTFWNVNQIWALAYPELMNGWCNFLVDMYNDGGLIPRGPSAHNYTFVMIGSHSTPFIVSAYMKGIRNFDVQKAYEGLRKNHFPGGMMDKHRYERKTFGGGRVGLYIEGGYIPHDKKSHCWPHPDGASLTLEYAYDDWCLAQMAKALGKEDDYRLFIKRAGNYHNLWDESTQFMRPRNSDGSWMIPFDPLALAKGFCEGNAWHYTWFVPHDVEGLAQLFGGRESFAAKLNQAFELAAVPAPGLAPFAQGEGHGYVCYANQPCLHMAHLFNYSGAPWLSQKWVREVKERALGGVAPRDGYRHDEDSGQLGGVGVLMAIGLFEVRGGAALDPVYEITSPIFDKVTIHLDERYYPGGQFIITTRNNSRQNKYIQSATLDGKPLNRPWFYHRQLVDGGTLTLDLGPEPNKQWGSRPEDAPPSMTGKSQAPAPSQTPLKRIGSGVGQSKHRVETHSAQVSEPKLGTIFNGSDFSGWNEPQANLWWTIHEGVLMADSDPRKRGSILWTEKEFRDFVLQLDFRFGEGTIDSGVFVRTEEQQIQIGISGSKKRDMTCSPYILGKGYPVEARGVKDLLKPDDWNTIRIRAEGKAYTVWLNGTRVLNYQSDTAVEQGSIGLQLHPGQNMHIEFRNIALAELPSQSTTPERLDQKQEKSRRDSK